MNVCAYFREYVISGLKKAFPEIVNIEKVSVEPTKRKELGELSTNAALVLSGENGLSREALEDAVFVILSSHEAVISCSKAGFVNFSLSKVFWATRLLEILSEKEIYGAINLGHGEKVLIEFVSANPTGPLHAGHTRNAVLGDSIARLLKFVGYDVAKEYYINDAGGQIDALSDSVYVRYRSAVAPSTFKCEFENDMYKGEYLIPLGQEMAKIYGDKFLDAVPLKYREIFGMASVDFLMKEIEADLASIGVIFGNFVSEKNILSSSLLDESLKILEKYCYIGVLPSPKGVEDPAWEEREQTLFKSTDFGDEVDRPLKKSDGSWTYFASDIAYHLDKSKRGFKTMINVFGADHAGYVTRISSAVKAVTGISLETITCQMVAFLENGAAVKMSKRAGTFVTLKEIVDKVGKDAARFMMVSRHPDVSFDFDFAKVVEKSRDNPIFYIQYACARINSVIKHATTLFKELTKKCEKAESADLLATKLDDSDSFFVIQKLTDFPRQVVAAAKTRQPHRLATYLYELATLFHSLWDKGKKDLQLRFVDPNNIERTKANLCLCEGVLRVLTLGLNILGITPVKEM